MTSVFPHSVYTENEYVVIIISRQHCVPAPVRGRHNSDLFLTYSIGSGEQMDVRHAITPDLKTN